MFCNVLSFTRKLHWKHARNLTTWLLLMQTINNSSQATYIFNAKFFTSWICLSIHRQDNICLLPLLCFLLRHFSVIQVRLSCECHANLLATWLLAEYIVQTNIGGRGGSGVGGCVGGWGGWVCGCVGGWGGWVCGGGGGLGWGGGVGGNWWWASNQSWGKYCILCRLYWSL